MASWGDSDDDDIPGDDAPRSSQLAYHHLVQELVAERVVAAAVTAPMEVHHMSNVVMMASFQV